MELDNHITARLFIVGCSRSGTTLLQGMLANHPDVYTFPETGVFLGLRGRRRTLPWAYINVNLTRRWKALKALERQLEQTRLREWTRGRCWRQDRAAADALAVFDRLAIGAGKSTWLEKTPRHFLHADWIARNVPGAHVIHLVRDGRDVVASLVDRARKYPDRFGRQAEAAYGIRLWNRAIRRTARLATRRGHTVVSYEDLVARPGQVMPELCACTGLTFREDLLAPSRDSRHIRAGEAWKARSVEAISSPENKFDCLFCPEERESIRKHLRLHRYRELRDSSCIGC